MKNLFFVFAILLPTLFAFRQPDSQDGSCDVPTDLRVTSKTAGTISFDWNGSGVFRTYYVRVSDGYTSPTTTVTSPSKAYSGLSAGTYIFYFWKDCGGGETSDIIVIEDLINA
jgi:hypothetical protein